MSDETLVPLFGSKLNEAAYDNTATGQDFIGQCLWAVSYMHAAHFNTLKYSTHKALDFAYSNIQSSIDEFAESYLGVYGHGVTIIPTQPFGVDTGNPVTVLDHLLSYANRIHGTFGPELTNPLEGVMTVLAKSKYFLSLE